MTRVLGRGMQARSLARFFQALVGVEVLTLVHRGRKTGTLYRTPLSILAGKPAKGEIFISSLFSRDADWYRNLIAGGLGEVRVRGEAWRVEWRELDEIEARWVGDAFRTDHPLYSRVILWMIARLNGFEGDPAEAAIQNLPMLGLRRIAA